MFFIFAHDLTMRPRKHQRQSAADVDHAKNAFVQKAALSQLLNVTDGYLKR